MEHPELEYVGFWRRAVATLIDTALFMLVAWPVLYAIYGAEYFESDRLIYGRADVWISWILPLVGTIWFWVARNGQTPGKMVVGARIVDAESGSTISVGKGVARYIGYFISMLGLCIGFFWVGFDPKKRGWHDHIAGTVVVRKKDAVAFKAA
jgi:uncharacterized RDD family membrane protein YckC